MRSRREDGRNKNQSRTVALSFDTLADRMNRRRHGPVMPPMCPADPADQQGQPTRLGDTSDLAIERRALRRMHAVMTKYDTRAARQAPDCIKQRIAHPFIGHEPEPGQRAGVALGHRPSYSGGMNEDAKSRLAAVETGIARAAKLSGRSAGDIALVAISKTQDASAIRPLLEAGQMRFGENRVQEAQGKWPGLRSEFPGVELHLVGQLQSNKAEEAVSLFDAIHSVDRPSLITALGKAQDKLERQPRCFIQVNIGNEPQKGGCAVNELASLISEARIARLDLVGLMAVPPADMEAAPYFALLAKLARDHGLASLSMGMTGDYETAIMLGATHVRIGSALFGART